MNNNDAKSRNQPTKRRRKKPSNNGSTKKKDDTVVHYGRNSTSYKGTNGPSVFRSNKRVKSVQNEKLAAAVRHYLNPFKYPIVRMAFNYGHPTALYERRLYGVASSGSTGKLAVKLTVDSDSTVELLTATTVVSASNLTTSTYTGLASFTTNINTGIWVTNVTMRFRYVGALVNRGGMCYSVQPSEVTNGVDATQAAMDPNGFVVPIDEKYIYVRCKEHHKNLKVLDEDGDSMTYYVYFDGLPNSSACMEVEVYFSAEFVPTIDQRPYVPVSSHNRLSELEQRSMQGVIFTPKLDHKAHDSNFFHNAIDTGKDVLKVLKDVGELGLEALTLGEYLPII